VSDIRERLVEAFAKGIASVPDALLDDLLPEKARDYGLRAARVAVAPIIWSQAVGERLDTGQAMELLGVTRQALAKRVQAGSLLGLPGRGTTYYPTWQFDFDRCEVRPITRQILAAFAEEVERPDPYAVAAWATTPQDEDLDGFSPAEWIVKDGDRDERVLVEAARRAAARLAW
jgi:hypothetical protein